MMSSAENTSPREAASTVATASAVEAERVRLWHKAHIDADAEHVRFWGEADLADLLRA